MAEPIAAYAGDTLTVGAICDLRLEIERICERIQNLWRGLLQRGLREPLKSGDK